MARVSGNEQASVGFRRTALSHREDLTNGLLQVLFRFDMTLFHLVVHLLDGFEILDVDAHLLDFL